jgi:subtilase family serine protease
MAPPLALVVAVAAITAVFFQALVTYSPDTLSFSSAAQAPSNGKLADAVAPASESSQFTLATLTHAAQKTNIYITHTSSSSVHTASSSSSPAATSVGAAPAAKLVAHEARPAVPRGWTQTGPAPASTTLRMRLALPHKNLAGLERALHEVSDPASAKYGKHLSAAQVNRYMKPAPASVKAVTAWLTSHGVEASKLAGHGNWLGFSTDVGTASKMFGAQFATYSHGATGTQAVRAMAYSIPENLKPHIALAHPMTR